MQTENEIIMRHDQGCRARAKMEIQIVNKILADAKKAGYECSIIDYEDEGDKEYKSDIRGALFNLDQAYLVFHKDKKRIGWVFLVFGNSGYDLICDYTTNLEEFLKGANDLGDRLEMMS